MHAKGENGMDPDLALQYQEARQALVRLYPLDAEAWNRAVPETKIRPYGIHHGLMFSGDFLGIVDLLSPDGRAYIEFRSVLVRPTRREVYAKTPEGNIQYSGYLLSAATWRAAEKHDRDVTCQRNHRRRP